MFSMTGWGLTPLDSIPLSFLLKTERHILKKVWWRIPPMKDDHSLFIKVEVKVLGYILHPVILLCRLHNLPQIISPIHSWFHLKPPGNIQPGAQNWSTDNAIIVLTVPFFYLFGMKGQWKWACPMPPLRQIQPGFEPMIFWSLIWHHNQFCHNGHMLYISPRTVDLVCRRHILWSVII